MRVRLWEGRGIPHGNPKQGSRVEGGPPPINFGVVSWMHIR